MTLDEAIQEFEFDCKIRHLSPKTIENYKKQLRYFERFLANELSITSIEDVKPSHIKSFLSKMDDAGRKLQYGKLQYPKSSGQSDRSMVYLTEEILQGSSIFPQSFRVSWF